MLTKTPFLTGFSTLLCGRARRRKQAILEGERSGISERCPDGLALQLAREIPPELLIFDQPGRRNRIFPDDVTFWAFLSQVFAEDGSCARAVARVQTWMHAKGQPVPSSANASFVEARKQLPLELLKKVHRSICDQLDQCLSKEDLWRGFRVKAEDGTSAQMPDTVANQADYPQPSSQAQGCGFPTIQLSGLIDLCHGGLRDFATGKVDSGELRGHDQLESYLVSGDLFVADRLYSSYEIMARLKQKGVEYIGRKHQSRKMDFRKGKKVGANERIQTVNKPQYQPALSRLSVEQWQELPAAMEIRVIRVKGPDRDGKQSTRYLVTTLIDAAAYPWDEVASLYLHRWEIELRFRDIKTTMGMELLRTKSPEMVRKEILMHMIAYNLVRLMMIKAGKTYRINHRRISFKGVVQVLEESRSAFERMMGKPRLLAREKANLWQRIAERIVAERPGRNEPRKKKRRPKTYGLIQKPRHSYFEYFHNPDPTYKILDTVT